MLEEKNANKVVNEVKIKIGGVEKVLKFNLFALCKLKEETGKNGFDDKIWNSIDPTDLRDLMWCALLTDDPNLSRDELSRQISMAELLQFPPALQKAFMNILPDATVESKNKKKISSQEVKTKKES